jgi:hypothetical protein
MSRSPSPKLASGPAEIARAEATIRVDAAWRRVYSEEFSRVYDEELTELLAGHDPDAAA